ncbi:MAG: hypothetical protein QS748_14875, partial [Candidatus Endonucleobacter bathymodioli]|nr:hypothetical protein [Candidatus Endonucleobacter bathymodioli]
GELLIMNNTNLNVKTEANIPDHTTKKEIVPQRKFGYRIVSQFKKIAVKIGGWKSPGRYISKGLSKLSTHVRKSVHDTICYIIPLLTGIQCESARTNSDDTDKRNNKIRTTRPLTASERQQAIQEQELEAMMMSWLSDN